MRVFDSLPPEIADAALALIDGRQRSTASPALNEAASLRLRHPHSDTTHLLGYLGEELVGYGQLHLGTGGPWSCIRGTDRHSPALGTALLQTMIELSEPALEIWATRHTPAAQALARRVGLDPVRQLLIMTRSLAEPIEMVEIPAGLVIRAFGRDGTSPPGWRLTPGPSPLTRSRAA